MYLHKGGRLSLTSGIFGTILGIKPVLTFNEGREDFPSSQGARPQRTIRNLARRVVEDGVELDKYEVYVVDADCGRTAICLPDLSKRGVLKPRSSGRLWDPSSLHTAVRVPGRDFRGGKERPIKLSVPEQEFNS